MNNINTANKNLTYFREIFRTAVQGFPVGIMIVYLIYLLGGMYRISDGGYGVIIVTEAMADQWGNPITAALIQCFWSGLLGSVFRTSGLPFRAERRIALWSGLHILLTAVIFSLAGWQCCWFPSWEGWLFLLGSLLLLYILLWAIRYIGWRQDVRAICISIGLKPDTQKVDISKLLPYFLLAMFVELALPPLLQSIDAYDVPVLTGIFYPYFLLPLFCFLSGFSLGKRFTWRWNLLFSLSCGFLTIPNVFLIYNDSALFQAWTAGIAALFGYGIGKIFHWFQK